MLDIPNNDEAEDGLVSLRVHTTPKSKHGSTYLSIDENVTDKNGPRGHLQGDRESLGIGSTHSSQDLSMSDVAARSYQFLNDGTDEQYLQVIYG